MEEARVDVGSNPALGCPTHIFGNGEMVSHSTLTAGFFVRVKVPEPTRMSSYSADGSACGLGP